MGHVVVLTQSVRSCCLASEPARAGAQGASSQWVLAGTQQRLHRGWRRRAPADWHQDQLFHLMVAQLPGTTKALGLRLSSSRMGRRWQWDGTAATMSSPPHPSQPGPAPESGRAVCAVQLELSRWDIASRRGGTFQTTEAHTRVYLTAALPCLGKSLRQAEPPQDISSLQPQVWLWAPQPRQGAEPAGCEAHIFPCTLPGDMGVRNQPQAGECQWACRAGTSSRHSQRQSPEPGLEGSSKAGGKEMTTEGFSVLSA